MGVDLLEWLRIDDPIGAVPVHGFCGIWGTLSLGLFACGQYGSTGPISPDNSAPLRGLFYGGGLQVLKAQIIGSACITVATFAVAMVVMLVVNAMGMLRLPAERQSFTAWICTSTEFRRIRNMSSRPWSACRHVAGTACSAIQSWYCGGYVVTRGELTNLSAYITSTGGSKVCLRQLGR